MRHRVATDMEPQALPGQALHRGGHAYKALCQLLPIRLPPPLLHPPSLSLVHSGPAALTSGHWDNCHTLVSYPILTVSCCNPILSDPVLPGVPGGGPSRPQGVAAQGGPPRPGGVVSWRPGQCSRHPGGPLPLVHHGERGWGGSGGKGAIIYKLRWGVGVCVLKSLQWGCLGCAQASQSSVLQVEGLGAMQEGTASRRSMAPSPARVGLAFHAEPPQCVSQPCGDHSLLLCPRTFHFSNADAAPSFMCSACSSTI